MYQQDKSEVLLKPVMTVFGVGGAGSNAVNNMIRLELQGAKFIVTNTDAQALSYSIAPTKIQLGTSITQGLGAGASPEVGAAAADESSDEIRQHLQNCNIVFITAGMGGGTGTGAAPVIARLAKELGILTVGVVTKPFHFEGSYRMKTAEKGLLELQKYVDTLIIIPNQNLFRLANERTTFSEAFKMADDVLYAGVKSITDLMIMPGLINLDFADIRAVMSSMGKAMMGTGEASGEDRAIKAAEAAISNPLLSHSSIQGAKGVLINITGGLDITLHEVDAAANHIRNEVGENEANIIFGSTFNPELDGIIRVSVVATGIDLNHQKAPEQPTTTQVFNTTYPQQNTINQVIPTSIITEDSINKTNQYSSDNGNLQTINHTSNITIPKQEEDVTKVAELQDNKQDSEHNVRKSKFSFFNRFISSNTTKPNKSEEEKNIKSEKHSEVSSDLEIHDIPAFLRKNKS